ncbi:MAG: class I SAM-dependent methyltransferase [Chloroflexi bacterium]|nr:class I SAM-dependent methyltransferase [Chloroflexota bacterium]
MSLTLERQNAYRQRYAQLTPGWQPATEVYAFLIRQYLQSGMRVLDVGCGRGGVFEQLGAAVANPIGLDPDWQSLAEHRLHDLPRLVATADHLPLENACLDMVLSSWVLEHLPDPDHTFAETARVLKLGGYFLFITPNGHSLAASVNRLLRPLQHTLVPKLYGREEADTFKVMYRANSRRKLEQLAQKAGFEVVALRSIKDPTYFAFHPVLFRLSVWWSRVEPLGMAEHLVGVYRKVASPHQWAGRP